MKNKLLLTSALAGVVALAGSAVAETKVSGNLEYVMNNTSGATAATSSQGSGFEENIKITNSRDIALGAFSYGFNLENAATEGAFMQLVNGATTINLGADSFPSLSATVVPNTGESFQTVVAAIGTVAYETSFDLGTSDAASGVARKNAIGLGVSQKVGGGAVSVRFVPQTASNNGSSAGANVNTGTSTTEVMYNGDLGVKGLKVMLGWAEDKASQTNVQKGKASTYGAAYSVGKVTFGAQRRNYEPTDTVAAQDKYNTNEYGIGFAINDNLSVALQHIVTDGDLNGTDFASKEKINGLGIGYNLGGIAIELSYAEVSNMNGVDGSDGEALQLRTVQSF